MFAGREVSAVSDKATKPLGEANIIPTLIAERCVHTKLTQASCHDCVDACPLDAWVIDEEVLAIDAKRCDGCGLCAASCRPGAVLAPNITAVVGQQSHHVLRLACEITDIEDQQGVIPCLHALGLHELLLIYRRGTRCLTVASGNCSECIRHNAERLSDRIAKLNSMLSSRGQPVMTLRVTSPEHWQPLSTKTRPDVSLPVISRRSFFRKAAESSLSLATGSSVHSPQQVYTPPAKLLPRTTPDDIVPFVPSIDATKCIGCDACARLCPHSAISLGAAADNKLEYRFDAERCTGCRICTDVCAQNAVSVDGWTSQLLFTLNLESRRCIACGAPYHAPIGQGASGDLCFICRKTNHVRNLYQVMDRTR